MRKSTRDWSAVGRETIRDEYVLTSRSSNSSSISRNDNPLLSDTDSKHRQRLFDRIKGQSDTAGTVNDDGKQQPIDNRWNQVVLDMRKLREALTSIGELQTEFAREAFELSVDINLWANDEGELIKSISHLMDFASHHFIYNCDTDSVGEATAKRMLETCLLFRLCLAFRDRDSYLLDFTHLYHSISAPRSQPFIRFPNILRLYRCLISGSFVDFWRIKGTVTAKRHLLMIERYMEPVVRRNAIRVVRKAYLQIGREYLSQTVLNLSQNAAAEDDQVEGYLMAYCRGVVEWELVDGPAPLIKFKR